MTQTNDCKLSWKEINGVIEITLHDTLYTLYKNVISGRGTNVHELYKFDDDSGPLILKFKVEDGKLTLYYAGFDNDLFSSAYADDIIDIMFEYFNLETNGSGWQNKNIIYEN